MLVDPCQERIAAGFRPISDGHPGKKQNGHRRPYGPAVTLRAGHASQGVREARADGKNRNQLKQIRKRSGVLERVRAVGIEKAATVGAELLDYFLRSHGSLCDGLLGNSFHDGLPLAIDHGLAVGSDLLHLRGLDELHSVIRLEVLNHSL